MLKQPLADKLRPQNIDQIVGQTHLLKQGAILRQIIDQQIPASMILYGPPGIGKSTIAHVISNIYRLPLEKFNASIDAKAELQKIAKKHQNETFILLLDEIHRMDKGKQDWLLSYMENGNIMLIGTTTANPIISINPAIRSRAHLFELVPVQPKDMIPTLQRAWSELLNDTPSDDILLAIAKCAQGDCRIAINICETLASLHQTHITIEHVADFAKHQHIAFDKDESYHYDTISAMQCSLEGSDIDAALYYLAVLLESGDLETALRRVESCAYEVVGLASPETVNFVVNACETSRRVGLPRCSNFLAQAIIMIGLAPKSDSGRWTYAKAQADAKNHNQYPIPHYIRDNHYSGAQKIGHGGMPNPFAYPSYVAPTQYLPDALIHRKYYEPRRNKHEEKLYKTYESIRKLLGK